MDGVIVLNTKEVLVSGGPMVVMGAIIVTAITLAFLILSVGAFYDTNLSVGFLAFIFVLGMGVFSYVLWSNVVPAYKTQYQVTINDEVNFNEFQQKYKIVSQEGLIYTVEDKEESE